MEVEGEQPPQPVRRGAVGGAAAYGRGVGERVAHASTVQVSLPCSSRDRSASEPDPPAAATAPSTCARTRSSYVGRCDAAEDAHRHVRHARVVEPGQRERGRRVVGVDVVGHHAGRVGAVGGHHGEVAGVGADDDLVGADPHRLAVGEVDQPGLRLVTVLEHVERAVVEDRAVLVDLDQGRAPVLRGRPQRLGEVLAVGVGRAGHEGGLGAEREGDRVERVVDRAHRGGLGDLADLGRGGVLPLGQAVDPVVEQQDLEVDVASQRVDQVVAPDRQRVTVTGHDPHRQVAARGGQAGGDGRRAAVDRVHAVGVEVVREPRGAADARDEDDVLALEPELGQEALHRGQDGVVAAAGAPADLLVGGELLLGLRRRVLTQARHAVGAGQRHTEVDGGHQRLTPSATAHGGDLPGRLVQHVCQVGCGEGQPTHLRVALHVDEVLGAQQQRRAGRGSSPVRRPAGSGGAPHRCWPGTG